jgi:hypothetical protein
MQRIRRIMNLVHRGHTQDINMCASYGNLLPIEKKAAREDAVLFARFKLRGGTELYLRNNPPIMPPKNAPGPPPPR